MQPSYTQPCMVMTHLAAGACLLVLREALTGWDALAAELREAASIQGPAQGAAEISTAAQAAADALCDLHAAGVLRCPHCLWSCGPAECMQLVRSCGHRA